MIDVNINLIERDMFYDGNVILKYHIEYPSINSRGARRFNYYNNELALKIQKNAEEELYKEAVETYKYNKKNGYPIMVYEVYRKVNVTYNSKNIVSLYIDNYVFTGGANGNTERTSQTWNIMMDRKMILNEFFKNDPDYILTILKEVNLQITKDPEKYFDDSCILVLNNFNTSNYYLENNYIVIYFQQYDIAPRSTGIPTFKIKY